MPSSPPCYAGPCSGLPRSQDLGETCRGKGPVPSDGCPEAILITSSLPGRKVCTGSSRAASAQGRRRSCVYICTYSVPPSSSLHLASPTQAREGERPCQSGPDPAPRVLHLPPANPASGSSVSPTPKTQGAREQRAGVGFALFCSSDSISLLHRFPLAPVGIWGWGKGQIYAAIFIHSRFRMG